MTRTAWRLLLAGGALILLVLGISLTRDEGAQATVTRSTSTPAGVTPRVPAADSGVAGLKLDLLRRSEQEQLNESGRDPFRFQPKAPPPGVARPARVVPPPPPAPPVAVVAPPAPTGPPPPPPIPLKFIGVLDAPGSGGVMAILSDSRGAVFYGKEGDIIEGRYKVLKIGADATELSYTDGRGRQTIRLGQ